MASVIVPVSAVHHLNHVDKPRRYVFKVTADCVQVERYANGMLEYRRPMDTTSARKLYAFLLRQGYVKW